MVIEVKQAQSLLLLFFQIINFSQAAQTRDPAEEAGKRGQGSTAQQPPSWRSSLPESRGSLSGTGYRQEGTDSRRTDRVRQ